MTAPAGASKLYKPEILALAVELAQYLPTDDQFLIADARSRSCGSTLSVAIEPAQDGTVLSLGMRVSACAIGQASAAVFASDAKGRTLDDLHRSFMSVQSWLEGSSKLPEWPRLEVLEQARHYPGRHDAILLPWRAALAALSKGAEQG